jgi:hypothetical protein
VQVSEECSNCLAEFWPALSEVRNENHNCWHAVIDRSYRFDCPIMGRRSGRAKWAGVVGVQRNPSSNQQAAAVTQLEEQRGQISREMITPPYNKGPLLIHNMDRASRLDDLINRVQSGEPVSPDEIDQALQPINR